MISAKTARERACATNTNVETTLEVIEENITAATGRGLFSTTVAFVAPQDEEEETIALLEATCGVLERLGYAVNLLDDDFVCDDTVGMSLFHFLGRRIKK